MVIYGECGVSPVRVMQHALMPDSDGLLPQQSQALCARAYQVCSKMKSFQYFIEYFKDLFV